MRGPASVLLVVVGLLCPTVAGAEPWPSLTVKGSPTQWAELAGWPASRLERVRLLRDLVFLFHTTPAFGGLTELERLRSTTRQLDALDRRSAAVTAVAVDWRSLKGAKRREVFDFLDDVGLDVVEKSGRSSIVAKPGPDAEGRRAALHKAGFDVDAFARALDEGRPARFVVPSFTVPLPLGPEYWRTRLVRQPLSDTAIAMEIVGNRRWALMYAGLVGLDDETLQALAAHPTFLEQLSTERLVAFASFSRSIRIRGGRVQLPGGDSMSAAWQQLAGAPPDKPLEFAERLLARDAGRLAWFFDCLQRAEPRVQAFALSSWDVNPRARVKRIEALYNAFWDSAEAERFNFPERPFSRPQFEPAVLLSVYPIGADGRPSSPSSIRYWQRVFDGQDLPAAINVPYAPADAGDAVDAEALIRLVMDVSDNRTARVSNGRASAVLLAESFAVREPALAPQALATIARASIRFPALIRSLERMRVSASTTLRAVTQAIAVSRLEDRRFHLAAGQFQAALSLVETLALAGCLTREQAEAFTLALTAVPLDGETGYAGGIVRWLTTCVLPHAAQHADVEGCDAGCAADRQLLASLSGRVVGRDKPTFEWDGLKYIADPATPAFRDAERSRAAEKAPTVDDVARLLQLTDALRAVDGPEKAKAAAAQLRAAASALPAAPLDPRFADDAAVPARVGRAVRTLEQIRSPRDLDRRDRAARELGEALDWAGLDLLRTLVYLPHLTGPRGGASGAAAIARRHDFGTAFPAQAVRDHAAWSVPKVQAGRGQQWHVEGAFLALDQAAVSLTMQEPLDGVPQPGEFDETDRAVLLLSATAWRAYEPLAQKDLSTIAARSRDARRRYAEGTPLARSPWPWNGAAFEWTTAHEPEATSSLAPLGVLVEGGSTDDLPLPALGSQFERATGSLAVSAPPRALQDDTPGYAGRGYYPAGTLDLKIRVAELMEQQHLPALLARVLIPRATARVLADTSPGAWFDWIALRRRMMDFSATDLAHLMDGVANEGMIVVVP